MAFHLNDLNYNRDNLEKAPWEYYTKKYAAADPLEMTGRLELAYDPETGFVLPFLGTVYHVRWPSFEVFHEPDRQSTYPLEENAHARILVLRYLLNGKASSPAGNYRTYREMPWGEVYLRQFEGRCLRRLAFTCGNRVPEYNRAMKHMNAVEIPMSDAGFELEVFRGYKVRLLLREGDEEFQPSSQFLFSDNFPVSFTAEDVAQMGDVIIDKISHELLLSE